MDTERALVLWGRLRVSNYVNVVLILMLFALSGNYVSLSKNGEYILLLATILSHWNYHYQFARVATSLGKSIRWWLASFVTFPLGPLVSYQFLKAVAIRSGLPV